MCDCLKNMQKDKQKVVQEFFSKKQDMFKNNWEVFEENGDKFATIHSAALECISVIVTFYECQP